MEEEAATGASASSLHDRMRAVEEGRTPPPAARQVVRTDSSSGRQDGQLVRSSGPMERTGVQERRSPLQTPKPAPEPNRPRLVVTSPDKLADLVDAPLAEDRSLLLDDVARVKGRPVETRKQAVTPAHCQAAKSGQATVSLIIGSKFKPVGIGNCPARRAPLRVREFGRRGSFQTIQSNRAATRNSRPAEPDFASNDERRERRSQDRIWQSKTAKEVA